MVLLATPNESTYKQEVHNILVIVLVFVLSAWTTRLCNMILRLAGLTASLRSRQLARMDSFEQEFGDVPLISRAQFEHALRSKLKTLSASVEPVLSFLDIQPSNFKAAISSDLPKRLQVQFKFQSKVPSKVNCLWGVSKAGFDTLIKKSDSDESNRYKEWVVNSNDGEPIIEPCQKAACSDEHDFASTSDANTGTNTGGNIVSSPSLECEGENHGTELNLCNKPNASNKVKQLFGHLETYFNKQPPSALRFRSKAFEYLSERRLFSLHQEIECFSSGDEINCRIPFELPVNSHDQTCQIPLNYDTQLNAYPLVIFHHMPSADTRDDRPVSCATSIITIAQFHISSNGDSESASVDVMNQYLEMGDGRIEELHTIYGLESHESPECVVCFTDPKDVTFLPCRHCCVCQECFRKLDKCPVCRAPVGSYLRFRKLII